MGPWDLGTVGPQARDIAIATICDLVHLTICATMSSTVAYT
jgi:hypothetical protein